jgi:F0F1-type ATP synthase assembly protein I
MKISTILLLATLAAFAIGIILSLFFNSLFLFIFLPFGFGWGFSRKSNKDSEEDPMKERSASS